MAKRKTTRRAPGEDAGPVIQPNKTDDERIEGLLQGDVDTEELPERQKTQRPIVVGLGASAGGLEALSVFFETVPPDTGLVFVVVTHLSPDHKSVLDELLQRHTQMPVQQVLGDQVTIEPNHVYVVPPNRQLVLTDSHLRTAEFDGPRAGRAPIDIFFRSLAAMHAEPVGIILSGGGSDGALGIRSVKEAGGLVMVQDPDEAAHASMPLAAIATGVADVVLPVRGLAQKLVEINRRRVRVPTDPAQLSPQQQDTLQRILTQLNTRTGHDFRAYKQTTVLRRIQRRMQLSGHETLEGYLQNIRQFPDEAKALLDDLLIGVTNFFRDEESWRRLADDVVPRLFAEPARNDVVRAWSIGCSTGEEGYSLAILLLEYAATLDNPPTIQVFATDLDEGSLARAREGYYPDTIAADVSAERLARFFTHEGSYYRVRPEVRDVVLFANHSVLRDPPFSRLDLLACRNLLIYLQRPLQDNLFELFYYALKPGGYLFLGNSETADSAADLFQTLDKKHRIYQAREWTGQQRALPTLPLAMRQPRRGTVGRPTERRLPPRETATRNLYERVLDEHGPPTILVDDDGNIIRLSGTAGRYLQFPDGPPTSNLTHLVRDELQYELRAGLLQAFERDLATVSPPFP
jgi:two-component system CheB/CheR fusion protein